MKKTKITVLSALACGAIVAGGFAAWTFSGDASSAQTLGVSIATANESGNVAIEAEGTLQLDQGSITWDSFDVKATYTGGSDSTENTDGTVVRTYTVSLDDALDDYIEISANASGNWTDGTTITAPTFAWVNEPHNMTEYNTMKSAIENSKITFTFSADWTDTAE